MDHSMVVPVDAAVARRAAAAHARWGRGTRTAGLNFGDCFAYDVAKEGDVIFDKPSS